MIVQGSVNEVNMEWLDRSMVAERATPVIFSEISKRLLKAGRKIAEVREWGSFMVLITFESKEAMADAMYHEVEWLRSLFYEVRPWSVGEWPPSRKVWIERHRLQPFAWSMSNFRAIGEAWGSVIGLEKGTVSGYCVGNARICIDSYQKSFIKGCITLDMGELKCDIYVREVADDSNFVLISFDSLENDSAGAIQVPTTYACVKEATGAVATSCRPSSMVAVGQK